MATKTVDVAEAESQFSELLSLILEGTVIILAKGDKPLAKLTSIDIPVRSRVPRLHASAIWTSDDFNKPMAIDFWKGGE